MKRLLALLAVILCAVSFHVALAGPGVTPGYAPAPAPTNGVLVQPDLLRVVFNRPGVYSAGSLTGTLGEVVSVSRASTGTCLYDGVEHAMAANQVCVDNEGLVVEPAKAQLFAATTDMTNATYWTALNTSQPTAGAADPLGGTSAFLGLETTGVSLHAWYQSVSVPASPSTVSFYLKAAGRSVASIASNSRIQVGIYDLGNVTATASGTGASAAIEPIGNGWYRCSLSFSAGTGLVAVGTCLDASNCTSFAGDPAKGVYLWRPDAEANPVATTWTATSRAVTSVTVPVPSFGSTFAIEVTATPVGSQRWDALGAEAPLVSLGYYQGPGSIEGYLAAGSAVTSVYDSAGAERHATASVEAYGGTPYGYTYLGPRTLTFSSAGSTRPTTYIDGVEGGLGGGSVSGAGTGVFAGGTGIPLRLGATSASNSVTTPGTTAAVRIREVRVLAQSVPAYRPVGAWPLSWGTWRGYAPPSRVIAAVGDSIVQYQLTPAWQTSHAYAVGNDVIANAFLYTIPDGGAGTSAASGTGPSGTGMSIADGTAHWSSVGALPVPYPFLAASTLGPTWLAHDFGVGSNTTAQTRDRVAHYVLGRGYQRVIVAVGINDLNTGIDASTIESNLLSIYRAIRADGGRVYPVTLLPTGTSSTNATRAIVNAWIAQWASQNEVPSVVIDAASALDDGTGRIAARYDLDGGSLHPNQAGQAVIGSLAATALTQSVMPLPLLLALARLARRRKAANDNAQKPAEASAALDQAA